MRATSIARSSGLAACAHRLHHQHGGEHLGDSAELHDAALLERRSGGFVPELGKNGGGVPDHVHYPAKRRTAAEVARTHGVSAMTVLRRLARSGQ
jgi:hypothetical protein